MFEKQWLAEDSKLFVTIGKHRSRETLYPLDCRNIYLQKLVETNEKEGNVRYIIVFFCQGFQRIIFCTVSTFIVRHQTFHFKLFRTHYIRNVFLRLYVYGIVKYILQCLKKLNILHTKVLRPIRNERRSFYNDRQVQP